MREGRGGLVSGPRETTYLLTSVSLWFPYISSLISTKVIESDGIRVVGSRKPEGRDFMTPNTGGEIK